MFGVFLIVVGIATGYYFVSVVGFFFLIPAFSSSPVRRAPGQSTPTSYMPRRIIPPPAPAPPGEAAAPAPGIAAQMSVQPQAPQSSQGYSPALFPTAIFPTLSLTSPVAAAKAEAAPAQKAPERDELLEFGAFLALLKLVSG